MHLDISGRKLETFVLNLHILARSQKSTWEVEEKSMKIKSVQLAPPPLSVLFSLPNHSHGSFLCGFFFSLYLIGISLAAAPRH